MKFMNEFYERLKELGSNLTNGFSMKGIIIECIDVALVIVLLLIMLRAIRKKFNTSKIFWLFICYLVLLHRFCKIRN